MSKLQMNNGADALYVYFRPPLEGMPSHGVVLAEWNNQYVVWGLVFDPHTSGWECYHGDYYPKDAGNLIEARKRFATRLARIVEPLPEQG